MFMLMLEDDQDRIERFHRVVHRNASDAQLVIRRSSQDFLEVFNRLRTPPSLIALDHDLVREHRDDPDPGDGRDVTRYLATRDPICPVLIHTSNTIAGESMLFSLRDAGWNVARVAPLGDDWIEAYWYPVAAGMMVANS